MAKEDKNSEVIEHGDLFFFYRPKIDIKEVKDVEDVQRFYMVTCPENNGKNTTNRLFLVGQKQMPEIIEGKSNSKERNWGLLNILQKQGAGEELGLRYPLEKENTQLLNMITILSWRIF